MAPDVSVIVVSYNARELLGDCLCSVLEREPDALDVEVVVVDNNSDDGSIEFVRSRFPTVKTVALQANQGFAAGNNAGIDLASGRTLLLLNSDAMLRADALPAMVAFLDANPQIGQIGPKLLNVDGSLQKSVRGFPTVWRLFTEYWYLRKIAPNSRLLNSFYAGGFDYDRERDVDFLMGACLLVRREACEQVGPMNESYFMYSEETDWAQRFWQAGWRVTFFPGAEVTHIGGASSKKVWAQMYQRQVAGHLRFLALHRSVRVARRAQRVLSGALLVRAGIYHLASVVIPSRRAVRAARAQVFWGARCELRTIDVATLVDSPLRVASTDR